MGQRKFKLNVGNFVSYPVPPLGDLIGRIISIDSDEAGTCTLELDDGTTMIAILEWCIKTTKPKDWPKPDHPVDTDAVSGTTVTFDKIRSRYTINDIGIDWNRIRFPFSATSDWPDIDIFEAE